jgi:transglutaminase-like putative cysteine protease
MHTNIQSFKRYIIRSIIFLFILNISAFAYSKNADVKIEKRSSWIVRNDADLAAPIDKHIISGGSYYLLMDHQENIASEEIYYHYVIKIVNNDGVQNMSDIDIDFEPSFQKLTFHEINIYRNGVKTDELKNHKIKTIQRETEMDRYLYDGSLTAIVNLKGVREGDIIEYSFTRKGFNPIYKGHYFKGFYFEYSYPVKNIFTRLVSSNANGPLFFNYQGQKFEPKVIKTGGKTEYVWIKSDVKALLYDNNVPEWYVPNQKVEVSSFATWAEAVKVELESFTVKNAENALLKNKTKDLFKTQNKDSLITQVIRFVQDNVRYLGFEAGLNAYKPHSPGNVFESRFGDCKDKSLLLCTILKLYGIEAYPVLVSSNKIKAERKDFPSPDKFNHCVAQILYNGKTYYIDATMSNQGGPYDHCFFPDYGYGLVIKPGTTALTEIPFHQDSKTYVQNIFVHHTIGNPVDYKVITKSTGFYADNQRDYFSSYSIDALNKEYLKFYSNVYPSIRTIEPIKYTDNRDSNIFVVEEHYIIDTLWTSSEEDKQIKKFFVYPMSIRSLVDIPSSPKRMMPYSITYPLNYQEDIRIILPEDWTIKPHHEEVKTDAFRYTEESSYRNRTVFLSYSYGSSADHVTTADFNSYYARHQTLLQGLSYGLTYNTLAASTFRFSWPVGLLTIVTIVIGIYFARRLYTHYDLPSQNMYGEEMRIGGWLVLIAIGLIVLPLKMSYDLVSNPEYFDQKTWKLFFQSSSSAHITLGIISMVKMVYELLMIIYACLLIFLFFERRTTLPRLIILLYIVSVSFQIAEAIIVLTLNPDGYSGAERSKLISDITRTFIFAAIWIPYFTISYRVKQTFTRRLEKEEF